MHDTTTTNEGLRDAAVAAWIEANVPGVAGPFTFRLLSGGRSNLTYELHDGEGRHLVLRRPPLGLVLQSAHDMAREHRIVHGLRDTDVPVATALGLCTDTDVTGAPFYLMAFAEGDVVRDEGDARRLLTADARAAATRSVVDVLAVLHDVDPAQHGLGDLGRRDGYVERQLRRMHRQFHDASVRDVPVVDEVHALLAARIPEQQRSSLVHGDYRIDNLTLRADGTVGAVLDWELCTLGDPLADLGLLMTYWVHPGEDTRLLLCGAPSQAPGFGRREELVARYAERTGLDVSRLPYYVALGYWKLACIAEGILARYAGGAMGTGHGVDTDELAVQVRLLADAALAALRDDEATR